MIVQEPREHNHGCHDSKGEQQEDLKEIRFYDFKLCHGLSGSIARNILAMYENAHAWYRIGKRLRVW